MTRLLNHTVRLTPELLRDLHERAERETARRGRNVTVANLIRRGARLVLESDMPTGSMCNVVQTAGGGTRCLACGVEGTSEGVRCPADAAVRK